MMGLAGGVGALIRFSLCHYFEQKWRLGYQALLLVNLLGCFLAGWILGACLTDALKFVLLVGLLGGMTSFSSLMAEFVQAKNLLKGAYLLLSHFLGAVFCVYGGFNLAVKINLLCLSGVNT